MPWRGSSSGSAAREPSTRSTGATSRVRFRPTFGLKREAEAFSRRVEIAKEDRTDTLSALGKMTLEFWEHFLATAANIWPNTRALYETHAASTC
jgi:hypothetical protein